MTDEANTCMEILRKAARFGVMNCQLCPAYSICPTGTAGWNNECMLETAANLIESLSAELEQVKRERDAAVEDLKYAGSMDGEFCSICKYQPEEECEKRKNECADCFEWRSMEED